MFCFWLSPWVIVLVLFYYWWTDRDIGQQPLTWFMMWACCYQTSPENMIIWIGLVKLFQIIYMRV
jgi:hypothetical protein